MNTFPSTSIRLAQIAFRKVSLRCCNKFKVLDFLVKFKQLTNINLFGTYVTDGDLITLSNSMQLTSAFVES